MASLRSPPQVRERAWLEPLPPALRLVLYGDAAVRTLAAAAFGAAFSEQPCRALGDESRATLWMGPDEYLLLASTRAEEPHPLIGALESALKEQPHALVDVSHRQFAFKIHGPQAANILNAGCPLDLSLAGFPVGSCTRTVFAKADLLLWRTEEQAFHLEIWRSFHGYVEQLLAEIAAEFDLG